MKRGSLFSATAALFAVLLAGKTWATETVNLSTCYSLALERSQVVAIANEDIVQAQARFQQALGSLLPQLSFEVKEILQDPAANPSSTNTFQQTFTRLSTPSTDFKLTQPLFRGFQEFNALKISNLDQREKALRKIDAERLLFLDVAIAYLTVARIERDIETTRKIIVVSRNQLGTLQKRIALGKNRDSEGAQQDTNLSLLEADLVKRLGDKKVAYEMMSFLTGLDPHPPLDLRPPMLQPPEKLEDFLISGGGRPDLQADIQGIGIAKGVVKIKKGDLLPHADLEANYYPYRVGFLGEIQWDTQFSLSVPLFNFETLGNIKDAQSKAKQAEYRAEEKRRRVVDEIKKAYDSYQSTREQWRKYSTATRKARRSHELQVNDFGLGLINALDVLQSQQTLFEAMRQRDSSEIQAYLEWVRLQVAAARLP